MKIGEAADQLLLLHIFLILFRKGAYYVHYSVLYVVEVLSAILVASPSTASSYVFYGMTAAEIVSSSPVWA